MLVIRNEQIQHFIAKNEDELVRLIRQIMRECCPGRVENYSDKVLDGMIRLGLEKAKKHNFAKAETIAAYVTVMFEIAPNFDEQPAIKQVLEDNNYVVDDRFFQLWQRVDDKVWSEAEKGYDAKMWFPDKK
jgi:hypothetical protein